MLFPDRRWSPEVLAPSPGVVAGQANWDVSTMPYAYPLFMAVYLVSVVNVDPKFVPRILLIGALCAAFTTFTTGILSDRNGRRCVYLISTSALISLPAQSFVALSTRSPIAITVVIILNFTLTLTTGA